MYTLSPLILTAQSNVIEKRWVGAIPGALLPVYQAGLAGWVSCPWILFTKATNTVLTPG